MADNTLFRSILVAYDGTPAALRVVEAALTLAQNLGAQLTVLGVVPPLSVDAAAEGVGLEQEQQFRPHLQQEMIRLTARAQVLSINIRTEIADGKPDHIIEARAKQQDVDLLVVGHRIINRVQRWFEGKSTAENIVSGAKTAVLIVPEFDE